MSPKLQTNSYAPAQIGDDAYLTVVEHYETIDAEERRFRVDHYTLEFGFDDGDPLVRRITVDELLAVSALLAGVAVHALREERKQRGGDQPVNEPDISKHVHESNLIEGFDDPAMDACGVAAFSWLVTLAGRSDDPQRTPCDGIFVADASGYGHVHCAGCPDD